MIIPCIRLVLHGWNHTSDLWQRATKIRLTFFSHPDDNKSFACKCKLKNFSIYFSRVKPNIATDINDRTFGHIHKNT